jgi:LPXTG-motif cell wall-anchored protein
MRVASGAIPLLEEAVHLLRRTPRTALLCHVLGAMPLALALLLFWNDVNNPHTSDATVGRDSMVLALLVVWMNCWRSIFAGRLRRQLTASTDSAWTWNRAWNLFAGQAFLGATKLVLLPLSAATIFAFAWTVAFYRSATALADRADLDPVLLMARARQLAGFDKRQSWLILPIIGFLWMLFTANLALTLAFLPQLIHTLTGYESQFSRSGGYYIFTPLFFWATLAISWMIFDPFIQAVYCLRTFYAESVSTGEDIRAGLRTLTAAVALLLVLLPIHAFANVPPQQLEQSVRHAMQSSEYDWRLPVPKEAAPEGVPWLVRVTNRLIDSLKSIFQAIGKAIDAFLDWLRSLFQIAGEPKAGALPKTGLHWSLYVMIALVLAAAGWIAWRRRWFVRAKPKSAAPVLEAVRLDAEDLTADRLPEDGWLELAAHMMKEENFRFALRAYYLANLAYLGRSQFLTIDSGKTNREYELELRRKARGFADARQQFAANIVAFERAWYGQHDVSANDATEFRQRIESMRSALATPRGAAA